MEFIRDMWRCIMLGVKYENGATWEGLCAEEDNNRRQYRKHIANLVIRFDWLRITIAV
jgi:hypothetical protein